MADDPDTRPPSRIYRQKPEHAQNPALSACAAQGMTEEQTLDRITSAYEELERWYLHSQGISTPESRFVISNGRIVGSVRSR